MIILAIFTILSIFYWILIAIKSYRRNLVLHALQLAKDQNIQTSYTAALYFGDEANFETADAFLKEKTGMTLMENFDLFFNDVCSIDVVFVVKLISLNSNSLAFRDIFNNLWETYLDLDDLKIKDIKHRPVITLKRPTAITLGESEDGSSIHHRGTRHDEKSDNSEETEKFLKEK